VVYFTRKGTKVKQLLHKIFEKKMSQTDRHRQSNDIVPQLVLQSIQAGPGQLAQIVETAASAPFAHDLLEVDQPLWGSFWLRLRRAGLKQA